MRSTLKRTLFGLAALVVAAGVTSGCGGRRSDANSDSADKEITCKIDKETRISIATGNTTGVYYALGNAYAEQISSATGGTLKATAAETGASVQNIQQVVAGTHQVAFSLFDTAADAVAGKSSFDKPQPVQALARMYDNPTHVVVRNAAGINSVADMKGKRISTGSPKSGTEVIAQRLLKAAGLDPDKDISAQRLDITKTIDGIKDGSIDAFVWSGGIPTPAITDLFTTAADKVKFIDITPLLPKMQETNAAYQAGVIPAATYKTPADVPTIVVPNVLLVRDDLDANIACVLTKTLIERKDDLAKANGAAKGISLDKASKTEPIKLHRGAEYALTKAAGK